MAYVYASMLVICTAMRHRSARGRTCPFRHFGCPDLSSRGAVHARASTRESERMRTRMHAACGPRLSPARAFARAQVASELLDSINGSWRGVLTSSLRTGRAIFAFNALLACRQPPIPANSVLAFSHGSGPAASSTRDSHLCEFVALHALRRMATADNCGGRRSGGSQSRARAALRVALPARS
eukprot:6177245-Pleurochrysis_carterae.AAC.2